MMLGNNTEKPRAHRPGVPKSVGGATVARATVARATVGLATTADGGGATGHGVEITLGQGLNVGLFDLVLFVAHGSVSK